MDVTRRGLLRTGVVLGGAAALPLTRPFERLAYAVAQPFVGEIMLFAGNFAPAGWAFCDGQLLPISENEALFTLIGTTYGGDGESTFALPNLQSRLPMHQGTGPGLTSRTLGQMDGTESVTLTLNQIPSHAHVPQGNGGAGSQSGPANGVWATSSTARAYATAGAPFSIMNTNALAPTGGSQPHENMMPFLTLSFCISLFGLFPNFS